MRITRVAGLAAALAVTLGACAGTDNNPNGAGSTSPGTITVGSANFPESEIVASMYVQVLEKGGFKVTSKPHIGSREVYLKALQDGEINLIPEYIGTLTEYFNTQLNGPDASTTQPMASGDPSTTFTHLGQLLDKVGGLEVSSYARNATDQNSFAVTAQTAKKYGLSTMSDLGKPDVQGRLVLGAGGECEKRPFCLPGLQTVYGASFKESGGKYRKFDNPGDSKTLDALRDGTIDIGLVFTSDGSVDDAGLVRLDDDKKLQPSDNICALAQKGTLDGTALGLVDQVNQTLTTDDLRSLNKKFNVDKADAETIAHDYLTSKGLL
ncbi:MAG TPA: ABC transporter substrate-binding protein [Mycobacteriales bacterium]|jgi:Periplasmic glycine betaine/choline-binding (lipo)protein of an ABC-type transport system (osmoprotectant binding protein)